VLVIFTRPLALVFMVLAVAIVTWTGWRELRQRRLRVEEQD
jgi:sensor domain CHASE-containing protein